MTAGARETGEPRAPRIVTVGETMGLATGRTVGPLATARDYVMGFGGSESNVAIGVSRLGVAVTWVSRLGSDGLGELIRRELRAEGVDVVAHASPDRPTGFMLKERSSVTTTNVTYYRSTSAAAEIVSADIGDDLLDSASLVHLTGITPALSASARHATLDVAKRARARGAIVSFDLNFRSKLWSEVDARDFYLEMLPLADVAFAGEGEARILGSKSDDLTNAAPETLARHLAQHGPTEAVIKRGADGATAFIDGIVHDVAPVRVDVVDTVGAGDAFVAGYLAELVLGAGPSERLLTAAATGALACTTHGDWEAAPRRADLGRIGALEPVQR